MTQTVKEIKLFRVITTLSVYPAFYVIAVDILEATKKAKAITDFYSSNKVVGTVSVVDVPILSLEEETA